MWTGRRVWLKYLLACYTMSKCFSPLYWKNSKLPKTECTRTFTVVSFLMAKKSPKKQKLPNDGEKDKLWYSNTIVKIGTKVSYIKVDKSQKNPVVWGGATSEGTQVA